MRFVSYVRATSSLPGFVPAKNEITEQSNRIKAYADAQGWKISRKYSDRKHDPNENAGFEQLRADGIKGRFDAVIIDSIFRAGRSFLNGRDVLLSFQYAGIEFVVVEDDFQSQNKTLDEINQYFASKNAYKNSLPAIQKRDRLHQEGKLIKKEVPFGYQLDADNTLVPEPYAASIVQRMFHMADAGSTITEIVSALHGEALSGLYKGCHRSMEERDQMLWERKKIRGILKNPAYIGHWTKKVHGKELCFHNEPIINEAVFERVRGKIDSVYDGPLTPRHVLIYYLTDENNSNSPIRLCQVKKKLYFELVKTNPNGKDGQPLLIATVEEAIQKRFEKEKRKAERMLRKIQQEGEQAKVALIEGQREQFRSLAARIVESEAKKMKAYQRFLSGELPQSEWETIRTDALRLVCDLEESFFAGFNTKIGRIQKAVSADNPWITSFLNWSPGQPLAKRNLDKLLARVVLKNMQIEAIALKQQDWYRELPREWREEIDGQEE